MTEAAAWMFALPVCSTSQILIFRPHKHRRLDAPEFLHFQSACRVHVYLVPDMSPRVHKELVDESRAQWLIELDWLDHSSVPCDLFCWKNKSKLFSYFWKKTDGLEWFEHFVGAHYVHEIAFLLCVQSWACVLQLSTDLVVIVQPSLVHTCWAIHSSFR